MFAIDRSNIKIHIIFWPCYLNYLLYILLLRYIFTYIEYLIVDYPGIGTLMKRPSRKAVNCTRVNSLIHQPTNHKMFLLAKTIVSHYSERPPCFMGLMNGSSNVLASLHAVTRE